LNFRGWPAIYAVSAELSGGHEPFPAGVELMEVLIVNLIFGIICALVASSKGRSPIAWFALGFFFPIIAIIVLCCIANLKEEELRRRNDYERTHRIREQLRQEQIKNEAFQRHAGARMDVHDRALGMNTRNAEAVAGAAAGGPAIAAATASVPPPILRDEAWYYALGNEQLGPIDGYALREMFAKGNLARTTLVWTAGMREWRRAQDVPELG
jgi:hypothetical protein